MAPLWRDADDCPPPVATAEHMSELLWPLYFARARCDALALVVGSQFESQNKPYLRGIGHAFGDSHADVKLFHLLSYVGVLGVPKKLYAELREQKLCYRDARDRVKQWEKAAQAA